VSRQRPLPSRCGISLQRLATGLRPPPRCPIFDIMVRRRPQPHSPCTCGIGDDGRRCLLRRNPRISASGDYAHRCLIPRKRGTHLSSFLWRSLSQMEPPPQLWHELLSRPCPQIEEPPQLLHELLWRPCSQMLLPQHSQHWHLGRL
jgi:hypothetical protein